MGLTGPNWAADGTSYLLMSSLNTRSRKEFRFNTAFDFTSEYSSIVKCETH